jgi:hypothetical protein
MNILDIEAPLIAAINGPVRLHSEGTLAKAYGTLGGYIAGKRAVIGSIGQCGHIGLEAVSIAA